MAPDPSIGTAGGNHTGNPFVSPKIDSGNSLSDAGWLGMFQESQQLLKDRLTPALVEMFNGLTTFRLHVQWPETPDLEPSTAASAQVCPGAERFLSASPEEAARCVTCLEHRWAPSQCDDRAKGWFAGACDAKSLCISLQMAHMTVLRLVLQGMPESTDPSDAAVRERVGEPLEVLARGEALLGLLAHDLEATLRAHWAERELRSIQNRPGFFELAQNESAAPVDPNRPHPRQPGPHAQHVVQAMVDYVRDHYQRPMALKEVATALGMNANYLSGLFHRTTGTAFHRYVHAVRMTKAEALLRDSRLKICDVASAVGYASPNHFRSAFKAFEKLSPKAWIESHELNRCTSGTEQNEADSAVI